MTTEQSKAPRPWSGRCCNPRPTSSDACSQSYTSSRLPSIFIKRTIHFRRFMCFGLPYRCYPRFCSHCVHRHQRPSRYVVCLAHRPRSYRLPRRGRSICRVCNSAKVCIDKRSGFPNCGGEFSTNVRRFPVVWRRGIVVVPTRTKYLANAYTGYSSLARLGYLPFEAVCGRSFIAVLLVVRGVIRTPVTLRDHA